MKNTMRAGPENASAGTGSRNPWLFALLTVAISVPTTALVTVLTLDDRKGPAARSGPAQQAKLPSPDGSGSELGVQAGAHQNVLDQGPIASVVPTPPLERVALPWANGAERVATVDLDGDGCDEVVLGGLTLSVHARDGRQLASAEGMGAVQVLVGGEGEVYAGWGWSRAARVHQAGIVRYQLQGRRLISDIVVEPDAESAKVSAIVPLDGSLLVAWPIEPYIVGAFRATLGADGEWSLASWAQERTATAFAVADLDLDGEDELVVGRAYGDEVGSDGDAWLIDDTGGRTSIPTQRGVRAAITADTDGDGQQEVVLADGWHKNYGKLARAQVRLVSGSSTGIESIFLDQSPGDYDVTRLIADDIDADGRDEIIVVTDKQLRVVELDDGVWTAWTVARNVRDAAVLHDGEDVWFLVVGEKASLLKLK